MPVWDEVHQEYETSSTKCILEHQRAIRNERRHYPLARHYAESHNSNEKLMSYFAVERIPQTNGL